MANTVIADKEKVEKRRALGRGLESLLPGPRVVPGGVVPQTGAAARAAVPTPSETQVPDFVRNDKGVGEAIPGVIQAVADDAGVVGSDEAGTAELRSARPGLRPGP